MSSAGDGNSPGPGIRGSAREFLLLRRQLGRVMAGDGRMDAELGREARRVREVWQRQFALAGEGEV